MTRLSVLDIMPLAPAARAFLRRLEGAGGRLSAETPADREHVRALLPFGLVGPSACSPMKGDRRAVEITVKGRAYLERLRSAH